MATWSGLGLGSTGATVMAAAAALAVAIGGTVLIQQSRSTAPVTGADDVPVQPAAQTVPLAGGGDGGSDIAAETGTASLSAPSQSGNGTIDGTDANVSATVIGGDGSTPQAGGSVPAVGTASTGTNATDQVAQPNIPAPRFDLVRIEPDGSTVIAGKSAAGKTVRVMDGDKVLAELVADRTGSFVAFLNFDRPGQARVLTLVTDAGSAGLVQSEDSVLVTPPPAGADTVVAEATPRVADQTGADQAAQPAVNTATPEQSDGETTTAEAPTVIITSNDSTRVVQPAIADVAPEVMSNVTIDAISYDNRGEVVLAGRGNTKGFVRVYVDNRPVKTLEIASDGSWSTDLPEVDAGVYTLRVDELDQDGTVTSRVETPFQKEFPDDAKRALGLEQGDGEEDAAQGAQTVASASTETTPQQGDVTQPATQSAASVTESASAVQSTGSVSTVQPDDGTENAVAAQPATNVQASDGTAASASDVDQTVAASTQGSQPSADVASTAQTQVVSNTDAATSQASPQAPSDSGDTPALPTIQAVTVQPGFTLWQLAERNYGEGNQYVRIYTANKDQIRNPDLIYPGQIFEIPE